MTPIELWFTIMLVCLGVFVVPVVGHFIYHKKRNKHTDTQDSDSEINKGDLCVQDYDLTKCQENRCRKTVDVKVKIPADLSSTGEEKWKKTKIDECVAPLVKALQEGGVDMRGSCCGHGKAFGEIHLQDGRVLLILNQTEANVYMQEITLDGLSDVDRAFHYLKVVLNRGK